MDNEKNYGINRLLAALNLLIQIQESQRCGPIR